MQFDEIWVAVEPKKREEAARKPSAGEWLEAEWAAALKYAALARRCRSTETAEALRRLCREKAAQVRALKTDYFILTGQKPQRPAVAPPQLTPETLRELYIGELTAAELYGESERGAAAMAAAETLKKLIGKAIG